MAIAAAVTTTTLATTATTTSGTGLPLCSPDTTTPCLPCYIAGNSALWTFPYAVATATVEAIPYIYSYPNGTNSTSISYSTLLEAIPTANSTGNPTETNATQTLPSGLYYTDASEITWTVDNLVLTYPTTYAAYYEFLAAAVTPTAAAANESCASPYSASMLYLPASTDPASLIIPLAEATAGVESANPYALPSQILSYLDELPAVQIQLKGNQAAQCSPTASPATCLGWCSTSCTTWTGIPTGVTTYEVTSTTQRSQYESVTAYTYGSVTSDVSTFGVVYTTSYYTITYQSFSLQSVYTVTSTLYNTKNHTSVTTSCQTSCAAAEGTTTSLGTITHTTASLLTTVTKSPIMAPAPFAAQSPLPLQTPEQATTKATAAPTAAPAPTNGASGQPETIAQATQQQETTVPTQQQGNTQPTEQQGTTQPTQQEGNTQPTPQQQTAQPTQQQQSPQPPPQQATSCNNAFCALSSAAAGGQSTEGSPGTITQAASGSTGQTTEAAGEAPGQTTQVAGGAPGQTTQAAGGAPGQTTQAAGGAPGQTTQAAGVAPGQTTQTEGSPPGQTSVAVIPVGGSTIQATHVGSGTFVLPSTTLTPGGQVTLPNGQTASVGTTGGLEVGGSQISLVPVTSIGGGASSIAAIPAGSTTVTAVQIGSGSFALPSTTLIPGQSATLPNGQTISVDSTGALQVGSSQISLSPGSPTAGAAGTGAAIPAGSTTVSAVALGGGSFALPSTTLTQGQQATLPNGQVVSVDSTGALQISGSPVSLTPLTRAAPYTGAVFTAGSRTFTASEISSGVYAIGSTTLTAGGSAVTLPNSEVVSAGVSSLNVGGTNVEVSTLNPSSSTGMGSYIMSGLQPGSTSAGTASQNPSQAATTGKASRFGNANAVNVCLAFALALMMALL